MTPNPFNQAYLVQQSGTRFIRGSVRIGKVEISYDFRECHDDCDLLEDRKSRDFTINSILMWIENG